MPNVQVRNVPPDVHDALKAKAARAGMSLSEYLLDELRHLAAMPTAAELIDRVRADDLYSFPETSAEILRRERDLRDSR